MFNKLAVRAISIASPLLFATAACSSFQANDKIDPSIGNKIARLKVDVKDNSYKDSRIPADSPLRGCLKNDMS